MTQDRNYLRMLRNSELIIMGRERDSGDDLVLVLTERLADLAGVDASLEAAAVKIEDLEAEIEEITSSREYWRIEATDAQDALEALQAQLEAQ